MRRFHDLVDAGTFTIVDGFERQPFDEAGCVVYPAVVPLDGFLYSEGVMLSGSVLGTRIAMLSAVTGRPVR